MQVGLFKMDGKQIHVYTIIHFLLCVNMFLLMMMLPNDLQATHAISYGNRFQ